MSDPVTDIMLRDMEKLRARAEAAEKERDSLRDSLNAAISLASEQHEYNRARAESLEAENERLQKAVDAVGALIAESAGVYGLHLNGDPSPWDELLAGGRFEEWLAPMSAALAQTKEQDE